jgi:hypothetical protein
VKLAKVQLDMQRRKDQEIQIKKAFFSTQTSAKVQIEVLKYQKIVVQSTK